MSKNSVDRVAGAREHYDEHGESWDRIANDPNDRFSRQATLARELIARHVHPCKTLDVGCGPGLLTTMLLQLGFDAYATDVSPVMTDYARRRIAHEVQDAEKRVAVCDEDDLPFRHLTFDLITANGLFPYVSNHGEYIHLLKERLNPRGYILASNINRVSLYTVRAIFRELRCLLRPSRALLRTMQNVIRTGVPSGTFLEGRENVAQAHSSADFDRLFTMRGFVCIANVDLWDFRSLDREPLNRNVLGAALARRLGWYHYILAKQS